MMSKNYGAASKTTRWLFVLLLSNLNVLSTLPLGENLGEIIKRIERTQEDIKVTGENIQSQTECVLDTVGEMHSKVDGMETVFDQIESDTKEVGERVEDVQSALCSIDNKVQDLSSQLDEIEQIATRVTCLEDQVNDVDVQIKKLDDVTNDIALGVSLLDEFTQGILTVTEEVDDKMHDLLSMTDTIEDTAFFIESGFDELLNTAEDIEEDLGAIITTLDNVEKEVNEIGEVGSFVDTISRNTESKVDLLLEKLVSIESQTNSTLDKVETVEDHVGVIGIEVTLLQDILNSIDDKVGTIESTVDTIEDQVALIENDVYKIENFLEDIKEAVDSIESSATCIETKVKNIDEAVESVLNNAICMESKTSIIETIVEKIEDSLSVIDDKIDLLQESEVLILEKVDGLVAQGSTFCIKQADIDQATVDGYELRVPGTYCLTEHLTVDHQKMIMITSDNVILDLNGYTITGAQGYQVIGVLGACKVIIKNGFIIGGIVGVQIQECSDVVITDILFSKIENNAIEIDDSIGVMIKNCYMKTMGGSGILITGDSSKCMVKDTVIGKSLSYAAAFLLDQRVTCCCVLNCKVAHSRGNGFQDSTNKDNKGGNLFLSCIAEKVRCAGFVLGMGSIARECTALDNAIGFAMHGDSSLVRNCIAQSNTDTGIMVGGGADNNGIISNYIVGRAPHTCTGISDMGAQTRIFNNIVHNCTTPYAGNIPLIEQQPTTKTGYWANIASV